MSLASPARAVLAAAALALLAGCASPAFEAPGTPMSAVLAKLGAPTGRYPLPEGGERLQYSELPAGSAVWNLDFDAAGRLRSTDQSLRYADFDRIVIGQWTAADVRRLMGEPTKIERVASFDGPVWSYRFNDMNNLRLIHVHLDPGGVVRKIQYTDELTARDRLAR
ncbi:hypothetical protein [Xylophilus sp. ASV27]|uniref:hypothetical protein n=1 Tax=Xylophilus sp. ASV27 TaxID=2795129 RepID=UPI0018EB0BB3